MATELDDHFITTESAAVTDSQGFRAGKKSSSMFGCELTKRTDEFIVALSETNHRPRKSLLSGSCEVDGPLHSASVKSRVTWNPQV